MQTLLTKHVFAFGHAMSIFESSPFKTNLTNLLGLCLLDEIVVVVHLFGVIAGGKGDDAIFDGSGYLDEATHRLLLGTNHPGDLK
jgi:hypothetical protein